MNRRRLAAALLLPGLLAACASSAPGGPGEIPAGPERRAAFLAGTSSAGATALVASEDPADRDAVAAFFVDPIKPYAARLDALAALRTLRGKDPRDYARLFPRVRPKLWAEVANGAGLSMSRENERGFVEAIGWLSDQKDPEARFKMEFHLDRATVKRKRLPDAALCAAALGLASYPGSDSARETLWAGLQDPKEVPAVRACCLKALQPFHPQDLEARVGRLPVAPGDDWLRDLQARLR